MAEEKSVSAHLEDLVRPLFPSGALIQAVEAQGGLVITAGWRLGSHRMDNWSKDIQVLIPPNVIERYAKLNEKGKLKAERNIVSFIKLKLSDFHPEHDRPRFLLPPVERWNLNYDEVFPKI